MKKFTRGHCYVISCVIFYVLLNNVLPVILCGFRGALKHISCIFQVSVDWNQHPLITVIDKDTFLRKPTPVTDQRQVSDSALR